LYYRTSRDRRIAILSVFVFADGGAGVGIKSNHLFSGNMAHRKTKHRNTLIITSRQKDRQKKKLHLQTTG